MSVHPKISERRRGVANDKSRKRSQTIFTLAFISMAAVIALALLASPLLSVREVRAAGYMRTDAATLVAASGIVTGTQLSDIDTDAVSAGVMDSSPWILSARVDRNWRGTVTIYVTERTAVIAIPLADRPDVFMLVDETGRQLESVDAIPPEVFAVAGLQVNGTPGQPAPFESLTAAAIVLGLSEPVADMALSLSVSDGLVSVVLADQSRIIFGDGNSLEAKMIAVETLFARVDMRCLHEIDVRVPAYPSITRRSGDGQEAAIVADLNQCQ